ncbi:MAG: hypothetical protein AB2A00_00410 [Myxococcota bacterium]
MAGITRRDIPFRAMDLPPEGRPGVPRESQPQRAPGIHGEPPPRQTPRPNVTRRADLGTLTPVFGTAVTPRGLSGMLRRGAYRIPDHRPSHWMTLMFADRVDVAEGMIRDLPRRPGTLLLGGLAAFLAIRALRR